MDRIALLPLFDLFLGTIAGAGVSFVVAHIAVGAALDQAGPSPARARAMASPAAS